MDRRSFLRNFGAASVLTGSFIVKDPLVSPLAEPDKALLVPTQNFVPSEAIEIGGFVTQITHTWNAATGKNKTVVYISDSRPSNALFGNDSRSIAGLMNTGVPVHFTIQQSGIVWYGESVVDNDPEDRTMYISRGNGFPK